MAGQQHRLPQGQDALLKSYASRLKNDIKSMLENFQEITRLGMCDQDSQLSENTQSEQDTYEMQVRASNIVRAGESLMKLVADLKQYLILNDFPAVTEALETNSNLYRMQAGEIDRKLIALRDDIVTHLCDLEEEYYMSAYKKVTSPAQEEK